MQPKMEQEREKQIVPVTRSEDLLLCRTQHICTIGEGERSFSKAFEERFMIRDMAMMADHNNFMTFDINDEKDALQKLNAFARYVLQPLNPVLQERILRIDHQRSQSAAGVSLEESKENSLVGSKEEGAGSSSGI